MHPDNANTDGVVRTAPQSALISFTLRYPLKSVFSDSGPPSIITLFWA